MQTTKSRGSTHFMYFRTFRVIDKANFYHLYAFTVYKKSANYINISLYTILRVCTNL